MKRSPTGGHVVPTSLAKNATFGYGFSMAVTLNISLSADQASWIRSRKEKGDFASVSDVVRDMIRREREKELATLEAEFDQMDKRDGVPGPAPVEKIVAACREVRKELLQRYEPKP